MKINKFEFELVLKGIILDVIFFANVLVFSKSIVEEGLRMLVMAGSLWGILVMNILLIRNKYHVVRISLVPIGLAVLLGVQICSLFVVTKDKVFQAGNNYNTCKYIEGKIKKTYKSFDETRKNLPIPYGAYKVYSIRNKDVEIDFYKLGNKITGYEIINVSNKYYYIGKRECVFGERKKYSEKKTIRVDALQVLKRNKIYNVKGDIAWGVTMQERQKDISIESRKAFVKKVSDYNGKQYYLWCMDDISHVNFLVKVDVKIEDVKSLE